MDDAMANASEAVALYVEGLREDGEPNLTTKVMAGQV
jgi:predicted RNase H-like HicB family nuclease